MKYVSDKSFIDLGKVFAITYAKGKRKGMHPMYNKLLPWYKSKHKSAWYPPVVRLYVSNYYIEKVFNNNAAAEHFLVNAKAKMERPYQYK